MAQLIIKHPDGTTTPIVITGAKTTIGRHTDNLICLEDSSVLTHHAEIVQDDGKFMLRDLNSSNGTKINGQTIRAVRYFTSSKFMENTKHTNTKKQSYEKTDAHHRFGVIIES